MMYVVTIYLYKHNIKLVLAIYRNRWYRVVCPWSI